MAHAEDAPPPVFVPAPRRRKPLLSVQSVLLIMLLLVSILSNVVIGVIGYVNGTDSLRDAATARVIEVRDARARGIADLYQTIENSMLVHASGESVIGALRAFAEGFGGLDGAPLSEADAALLDGYYAGTLAPALEEAVGEPVDVAAFVPTGPAQRYLQAHYTVPPVDFDAAIAIADAGDGSAWSAAHARYHPYFARMVEQLDYQDLLLIDTEGNVVYSAFKGIDLGSNLRSGPYSVSNLASAYTRAMSERVLDSVVFTDFETYRPSIGLPAAWGVGLVSQGGEVIGALAVEMPIERIANVMRGGEEWSGSGLGATGEAYLVGRDGLMRSPSRDLAEQPDAFASAVGRLGVPQTTVDRAAAAGSPLLLIPVSSQAVQLAQQGQTGTVVAPGSLGTETIAAYAPLGVEELGWSVIAEVDTSEAFAPVNQFTTNLFISSAILVLLVSILSLVIAQWFVRPLRRLQTAAEQIAAGQDGVTVDAGTADEYVAVANAFNDMSRSLQVKNDLLEAQQKENDRLLLSFMPETIAQRYKEGATTIAQEHQEAAVVYADIVGFEAYSRTVDTEHELGVLNELVKQFDQAAERFGVERVRTTRQGYLAGSGLSVPRIDAARRVVDFAQELSLILARHNAQSGTSLGLRAGIDVGSVTSGLIGQQHVAFDLWGEAAGVAVRLQGQRGADGVFLSDRVRDRLADAAELEEAGWIDVEGGPMRVWRLVRI